MLQPRLNTIFNMLTACDTLVDIGTDHGLLVVEALCNCDIKRAIATDISAASVEKARRAVLSAGLQDRVNVFESDGFDNIEDTFEQAVLAGMGGPLIIKILENAEPKILPGTRLIIQPQNEYSYLREWLWTHKYKIERERLVIDKRYLYVVMSVLKTTEPLVYDEKDLVVGRNVEYNDIKTYKRYLKFLIGVRTETLKQIQHITDKSRIILGLTVDKYIKKLKNELTILESELARSDVE